MTDAPDDAARALAAENPPCQIHSAAGSWHFPARHPFGHRPEEAPRPMEDTTPPEFGVTSLDGVALTPGRRVRLTLEEDPRPHPGWSSPLRVAPVSAPVVMAVYAPEPTRPEAGWLCAGPQAAPLPDEDTLRHTGYATLPLAVSGPTTPAHCRRAPTVELQARFTRPEPGVYWLCFALCDRHVLSWDECQAYERLVALRHVDPSRFERPEGYGARGEVPGLGHGRWWEVVRRLSLPDLTDLPRTEADGGPAGG